MDDRTAPAYFTPADAELTRRIGIINLHDDFPIAIAKQRFDGVYDSLRTYWLPRFRAGGVSAVVAAIFTPSVYVPEGALRYALWLLDGLFTLGDLHRFAAAAGAGTLVGARTQQQRLRWVPTGGAQYGFAIMKAGDAVGHNGQMPGYTSFIGYVASEDAAFVVLVNLTATRSGQQPADEIALAILKHL
ncbi:MAG TPA: serine hydrolase [bacterium]|nr:serine hydrolase [bacterium]